jgi:hypothetical protein
LRHIENGSCHTEYEKTKLSLALVEKKSN